jgi:hypothetical protein
MRDRRDLIAMADAHARGEEVHDSMLSQGLPTSHDTDRLGPNTGDVNTLGRVLPNQDDDENADWEAQPEGYESWKVADLKDELERRGLKKSGSHEELVARLNEDDEANPEDSATQTRTATPSEPRSGRNVGSFSGSTFRPLCSVPEEGIWRRSNRRCRSQRSTARSTSSNDEIDKHGKVIAQHKAKIQDINAEKDDLLTVRESLVRLGSMSSDQINALVHHLQGAGGIESSERVGDA